MPRQIAKTARLPNQLGTPTNLSDQAVSGNSSGGLSKIVIGCVFLLGGSGCRPPVVAYLGPERVAEVLESLQSAQSLDTVEAREEEPNRDLFPRDEFNVK